jgi:predicted SprT family Zn-dependent metalloprotease
MPIRTFERLIPEKSHAIVRRWSEQYRVVYLIVARRKTKLGDYRYDSSRRISVITLNEDSNPYRFLVTLVHELAHARVHLEFSDRLIPHGKEWKAAVKAMMFEMKDCGVFPYDLEVAIERHFSSPKYTDTIDAVFVRILGQYDRA